MRTTRQREAILRVVRSADSHPTADAVYDAVRKEIPGISLGTVYRNLKLLAEAGEVMAMENAGCSSRFDGCTEVHHHFRCEVCGRVFDVADMLGSDIDRVVEAQTGFEVRGHCLEFRGVCASCGEVSGRE
ncbi:MAG: transcriptional repressor [Dehalococcoidia bacterium]|nr:transcriptional repressor [Dehalococcoidia bacterium]